MKPTSFIIALISLALLIPVVVFLMQPLPIRPFNQTDCVRWLEYDRSIHEDYLQQNEDFAHNGTWASHQQWVDDFTEIIARVKKEPSKLTKTECLELLRLAQASHAGDTALDYNTIEWNARWFWIYAEIIQYMEQER